MSERIESLSQSLPLVNPWRDSPDPCRYLATDSPCLAPTKRASAVATRLDDVEKTGKFWHLSTPTDAPDAPDPWVRMLNGKRGLHLVVLYLVIGEWRVPWSFRVWRGKGQPSPVQLACKLLATVPKAVIRERTVIVQADPEFGTVAFLDAVRQRQWRAVVGTRNNRRLRDRGQLKD